MKYCWDCAIFLVDGQLWFSVFGLLNIQGGVCSVFCLFSARPYCWNPAVLECIFVVVLSFVEVCFVYGSTGVLWLRLTRWLWDLCESSCCNSDGGVVNQIEFLEGGFLCCNEGNWAITEFRSY